MAKAKKPAAAPTASAAKKKVVLRKASVRDLTVGENVKGGLKTPKKA